MIKKSNKIKTIYNDDRHNNSVTVAIIGMIETSSNKSVIITVI